MDSKSLAISDCAQQGVNSDLPPKLLPVGAFEYGFNYRIQDGFIHASGSGYEWVTLGVNEQPGYVVFVNSITGEYWLICTNASVQIFDGTSTYDISHPDGYSLSTELDWTGCSIANIPIINHPSSYPQYWAPQTTGTLLEYLPWDATRTWKDVNESCRILRSHKQFLFAMDLQSGSEQIVDGVRWSSPADIGSVPESWDHLDVTNVAGLTNLGGNGGRIVDGMSLRDAFVVYRESGITIFDYVGGQFVWQIRNLETVTGLISRDSIAEVNEKHYFIGDGDIYVNDGNRVTSIMYNRIRKLFQISYNPDTYDNSFVINNEAKKEIWFCVPAKAGAFFGDTHFASDATHPNVAFIYNWREDEWGIRQIEEAPFASYGTEMDNGATWDASSQTWDSSSVTWDVKKLVPLENSIITVRNTGSDIALRFEDKISSTDADNSQYTMFLLRTNINWLGTKHNSTIQKMYPDTEITYGTGNEPAAPVQYQLGSHDIPLSNAGLDGAISSSIRTKAAVGFKPEVDRKVDLRTTGEYHMHSFTVVMHDDSVDAPVNSFKLAGFTFDFVEAGHR